MMLKTYDKNIDKARIAEMPQAVFPGRIIVILTPGEAERAVDYLLTADVIGLDTETRPSFKKGQQHKVALLQVSTREVCFLFRLNLIGLCPAIKRLLEDKKVKKVGLSFHDDIRVLHGRGAFEASDVVELQQLVKKLGIEDMSLQKIYANVFGQKISKRQQLSNWEVPVLTEAQKMYASLDAWACVRLYDELTSQLNGI